MFTYKQVMQELKELRYIEYSINTFEETKERLKKQYDSLSNSPFATKDELEKIALTIEKLDTNEYIKKSLEKKTRYLNAIAQLDGENQSIIIDAVINGTKYEKVANKVFLSYETVRKRIYNSVNQIVDILNKQEKIKYGKDK